MLTELEQKQCLEFLKKLHFLSQLAVSTRDGKIVNGLDHNDSLNKMEKLEPQVTKFLYGK